MKFGSFWTFTATLATLISLFTAGCGGSGSFDDFSDISVPDSYMRKKAEAVEDSGVSSKDAATPSEESDERKNRIGATQPARSSDLRGGSRTSLRRSENSGRSEGSGRESSGSIPERLYTAAEVNPSISSGYAAACEYLRRGETEIGIEKLKHLATLTYAEPEICSQIYFVIADTYEKAGNIRESNEFFDKFNDNLKKHRDSKPVQDRKSGFSKRDEFLKKFYPPAGEEGKGSSDLPDGEDSGNSEAGSGDNL